MAEFVQLHNHSDFSLLRASSTVPKLVKKARKLGMPAMALTDDGSLFGALRFYKECKNSKDKDGNPLPAVKPIVGCDFYVAHGSRHEKSNVENAARFQRLVLLATSDLGYRNLCKLSSIGYTEGFYYKPRIDHEVIEQYHQDVIALSGDMSGEIPQLINRNRMEDARKLAAWYRDLFGPGHFYLELNDHGIAEQKTINHGLLELARDLDIPVVAANSSFYLDQDDADAHDVLICIGGKKKRHEAGRSRFPTQEFYVKGPDEMEALFGHIPGALENSLRIAEMCNLDMELPGPLLPEYEIPQDFAARAPELVSNDLDRLRTRFAQEPEAKQRELDEPTTQYFVWESNRGLRQRYENPGPDLLDRLDYELYIIIKMGFIGYFLIVWDFIRYAKEQGIPVGPGRGSGAGSIVAYSLKITDIDPIRYNLLFERFLNPERVSMPDFDIDFCFERRQEVIDYVTRKYGTEKVGQIITFGTLKPKAVLKDVARALDISFEESNMLSKAIPDGPPAAKLHLSDLLAPELAEKWVKEGFQKNADEVKEIYARGGVYQELFDIAMKLEGLSRHASTHAAGIVIGKTELTNYVPLFRDPKTGAISTQYTMDLLEECGLVKMDFLGLKTLTLIKNTEDIIQASKVPDFTIEKASETDATTYKMLGEGKSAAVFQFDGEGMQRTLEMAKPTCIEDLIALNALYRPGPLEYIPQFVDAKWGRQEIVYPHKSLEGILKETYGVIVYQEQVMQAAQIVGGYTLGGADLLRRAMGKKKVEEMAKHRAIFSEGAAKAHSLSPEKAGEIFDILEKFAGYGFNKSHAAAYSVLAYRTAYLKANFPAEFMAANLTNEINNPDAFKLYLGEARNMGLRLRAPDINRSDKYFTVVDGEIVFGLIGLKGIGSSVVDEVLGQRQAGGPYRDLEDFLERIDLRTVNKKSVEVLINSGALRSLCPVRKVAVEKLDLLIQRAHAKSEGKKFGQTSLFDATPDEEFAQIDLSGEEYDLLTLLKHEKDILGHYFSGHPLDQYRAEWEKSCTLDLSRPEAAAADRIYNLVAMVANLRVVVTKKGSTMAIVILEDYNGSIECALFSRDWEKYQASIAEEKVVGIRAKVKMDQHRGGPQLMIEEIVAPEALPEKDAGEVHIRLRPAGERQEADLLRLRDRILEHGGRCSVYLHLPEAPGKSLRVSGQLQIRSMPEVLADLRANPTVLDVWKLYPAMGPYGQSRQNEVIRSRMLAPPPPPEGPADNEGEATEAGNDVPLEAYEDYEMEEELV